MPQVPGSGTAEIVIDPSSAPVSLLSPSTSKVYWPEPSVTPDTCQNSVVPLSKPEVRVATVDPSLVRVRIALVKSTDSELVESVSE